MRYMLDTNVLIHVIRNKSENVKNKLASIDPDDVCISSITYAELEYGVQKSSDKQRNTIALMRVMSGIRVVPFDEKAAIEYGNIRSKLESEGMGIGPNDTLIAAHAKALELTLVTNNTREFERVFGLKVEDWTI